MRGTEIGRRNQPSSSTILNFQGRTQVGNIFPEVNRLFLKAFKVAFSAGSWNNDSNRWVLLHDMQGTTVGRNLPPAAPFGITPQDQMLFMRQLTTYAALSGQHPAPGTPVTLTGSGANHPVGLILPGSQNTVNNLTTITVPPKLVPQVQVPPPPPPPTHTSPGNSLQPGNFEAPLPGAAIFFTRLLKIFTSPAYPLMMALVSCGPGPPGYAFREGSELIPRAGLGGTPAHDFDEFRLHP